MVSNDPAVNPGVRPGSLASKLQPHQHDQQAAIALEVAIELLNQLVGECVGRKYEEEAKSDPDPQILEECDRVITETCAQLHQMYGLTPQDIQELRARTVEQLQYWRSL